MPKRNLFMLQFDPAKFVEKRPKYLDYTCKWSSLFFSIMFKICGPNCFICVQNIEPQDPELYFKSMTNFLNWVRLPVY